MSISDSLFANYVVDVCQAFLLLYLLWRLPRPEPPSKPAPELEPGYPQEGRAPA